jgi:nucleotide-binding universal stress UspA family protein
MSIFPTKILLATDGSKDAELAATTAINLANTTNSELHILTVGSGYPSYDVRVPEVAEELRHQAQNILDEQANKIEQAGGKIAQEHLRLAEHHHPGFEHHPSDDVVGVAEEKGAGLIVLGSRGLGGVRRALMGSVSDSVVRHAHCPVMVVRGEAVSFPARILLATDGSEESKLAASTAADLAKSTNSELHVVCVGHIPTILFESPEAVVLDPDLQSTLEEDVEEAAKTKLNEQVQQIGDAGIEVAGVHTRLGNPDAEIVELAGGLSAGLIVMGSRGRGPLKRALMGSVSESVVRHAHCPVIVVRPEKERSAEHEADFLT